MTKIKSFSVGNGDMFYINHASDNFTIIDCYLNDDNKNDIINELLEERKSKSITRFISTHPDFDHIGGLKHLNEQIDILNFYCVANETNKENDKEDFKEYYSLRDDAKKAFYLSKGAQRKRMNSKCDDRGGAGINILWPDIENQYFLDELDKVKNGESPNNISPIFTYELQDGAKVLWMGDIENSFMEKIINEINFGKINIVFAPHHGRESGNIPKEWLTKMNPDLIIMGEAPSENLSYDWYNDYSKITQNSAKDITFICEVGKVHIFSSNINYECNFLAYDADYIDYIEEGHHYIGTISL